MISDRRAKTTPKPFFCHVSGKRWQRSRSRSRSVKSSVAKATDIRQNQQSEFVVDLSTHCGNDNEEHHHQNTEDRLRTRLARGGHYEAQR